MVTIRLTRGGGKKEPFYHLVVTDKRNKRDGRFIERIGFYNPVGGGAAETTRVNFDRFDYWVGVGAKPSDRVAHIVKTAKEKAA